VSLQIRRWAWWGRTSTDDLQDPTLSLPRQLSNCHPALPPGGVIVAHFYDVESGRKDLDTRGRGHAHEQFDIPIPRDGGIQDLLAEAARADRRFDGVICESIDRVARRTYYGTKIEHELERVGVLLVAADEPMHAGRKRATAILTRRVKQGVAEWYALEALEKSWDGFKEHTVQGFNVGRPPYGYQAQKIPHPVPARREQGKTKTRLILDPVRAPVVRYIYDLYLSTGLGLLQIRDKLNTDPEAYPPPKPPDPTRALGVWSISSVWEILRNPKYTGYMVWNRRARKSGGNRTNPPSEWIWSPKPTHEDIVSLDEYKTVAAKAAANEASRRAAVTNDSTADGTDENATPPRRAEYLYRGLVRCGLCGLRMTGNIRRTRSRYYFCYPHKQRSAKIPPNHPPTIYLPEPVMHEAITSWLAYAIFGPDRADYWRGCLTASDTHEHQRRAPVAARLTETNSDIADLTRRLQRQILNLEADDITPAARRQVTTRIGELETDITKRQATAEALRDELDQLPPDIDQTTEALARLPQLAEHLADMPQPALRRLYDALDLQIRYQPTERILDVQITLTDAIADISPLAPPDHRMGPASQVCSVPPAGFEPAPPPPEGGALSPELRGLGDQGRVAGPGARHETPRRACTFVSTVISYCWPFFIAVARRVTSELFVTARTPSAMWMPPRWCCFISRRKMASTSFPVASRSCVISASVAMPGIRPSTSAWVPSGIQAIAWSGPVGPSPQVRSQVSIWPIWFCCVSAMSRPTLRTSGSVARWYAIIAISTACAWWIFMSRAKPASGEVLPGSRRVGMSRPRAVPRASPTTMPMASASVPNRRRGRGGSASSTSSVSYASAAPTSSVSGASGASCGVFTGTIVPPHESLNPTNLDPAKQSLGPAGRVLGPTETVPRSGPGHPRLNPAQPPAPGMPPFWPIWSLRSRGVPSAPVV
jgi:site-specific DNA recombinase